MGKEEKVAEGEKKKDFNEHVKLKPANIFGQCSIYTHILRRTCTEKSSILHTTYPSGVWKILLSLMMATNSMAILKGKVVSLCLAIAFAHPHTVHGMYKL